MRGQLGSQEIHCFLAWLDAWERHYRAQRSSCLNTELGYYYKLRAGEMERARAAFTSLLAGGAVDWPDGHPQ